MTDAALRIETPPSPFVEGTNLQYAWDSTSIGLLKECPRKYAYTILEGWRKKDESVHLTFGGEFASTLEQFHKTLASGMSYDDALDLEVWNLLIRTHDWHSDHPKKNRDTLLRTVIWYLEAYRDDPAKTIVFDDGKPAVELSFKIELDLGNALTGEPYLLCGHMDRIVDYAGDPFVMDQKTTGGGIGAYYFAEYNPDNQMSLYTFAGRVIFNIPVAGVIIDAAQINVGYTNFARGFTMRTQAQIDEWLAETYEWIHMAEYFVARAHWPMNDKSCHKYGGCPFRIVCDKDPATRDDYLRTYFERSERWNPLKSR